MAMKEDSERPVPRSLQKDTSTPVREEGMGIQGYMIIAAILAIVVFVGASFYGGGDPPQAPKNTPANDRTIVNPAPSTTPR